MGFLLVREGLIDPQELREALRLQIARIVYTAFRWPDGRFRFSQEGMVDYDADHMAPVSIDSILMEAAQMVDEWPLFEKKVGSLAAVYRRAPGVENLRLVSGEKNPPEGTLSVSRVGGRDLALDRRPAFRQRHHGAGLPLRLRGSQGHRRSAGAASDRDRPRRGGGRDRAAASVPLAAASGLRAGPRCSGRRSSCSGRSRPT